jgi:hypothetical protein
VFSHTLRIYKNVINEHHDKLVQFWHEDGVHEIHEVCWRIHQSKRHDEIFKETISCSEGCLGYVFDMNLDLMIAGVKINFRDTWAPTN